MTANQNFWPSRDGLRIGHLNISHVYSIDYRRHNNPLQLRETVPYIRLPLSRVSLPIYICRRATCLYLETPFYEKMQMPPTKPVS